MLCMLSHADTNPNGSFFNKNQVQISTLFYTFSNDIFIKDSRLYVPIRELANILNIPIEWDEEKKIAKLLPENKRVMMIIGETNQIDKSSFCVVPDEGTAYNIGKIVLESVLQESVVFNSKEWSSELEVSYEESTNYWLVTQKVYYKGNLYNGVNANNNVLINKNTGEIIKIILLRPEYEKIRDLMQTT